MRCVDMALCLALLFVLVASKEAGSSAATDCAAKEAGSSAATEYCTEKEACSGTDEQSTVTLMQLKLGVRSGSHGNRWTAANEPAVVGRTVLSTDPRATAEWAAKYYVNAKVLPSFGECNEAERAAVLFDMGGNETQLMVFVKPKTSLESDLDPNVMIPRIEQTVKDMYRGASNYTMWYDNHDGFRGGMLSVTLLKKALADGYKIGGFKHMLPSGTMTSMEYIMFLFPHTMYGIQDVSGEQHSSGLPEFLPEFVMQDCRTAEAPSLLERRTQLFPSTYWKATFMANNPGKAADFAVKVLGATEGISPYPWPAAEGCTGATWVQFDMSRFQLHFVNSPEYQPHEDTVKAFTQRVLSNRDLKAGYFDPYMYNSFIMTVKSLDPYVERLRAQSLDFLLVKVGEEYFALFISIPDNDITFQLRSAHLSVDVPTPVEMCTQQFGGY